jgi:N-acetylglucosaminyldiphosphoundecaprenol N-acetyl-beta-D-mannosaminyltransferase
MGHAEDRVRVLGVPVDPLTSDDLQRYVLQCIRHRRQATILHANVHAINLARRHDWFARALGDADLVFCDGYGVMLGARILGRRLPQRITYAEWMWQLAALCRTHDLSLFLVGARPGVAAEAAARLVERHPGLEVVGTRHGYFDKAPGGHETRATVAAINDARPDVVVVGFGMPVQERWVADVRGRIDAPVVLTGGAVFDYVSGRRRRAPLWMTDHGLEWLGRLLIEPRRLAGRYLIGNPLFLFRVLGERVRMTLGRGRAEVTKKRRP